MNTRLDELLRQRELMREHLRWLENEIVSEQGEAPATVSASSQPAHSASPPIAQTTATHSTDANPDPLPEPDVRSLASEVRSGCMIYAAILFGSLAALVGFIYWKY
jgi:septum formation inhibitor MinC